MIAQDEISKFCTIVALLIPIYLWLFTQSFVWLFPAFLILTGFLIQDRLLKKKIPDQTDTIEEGGNIVLLTLIAVATLVVTSMMGVVVSQTIKMELTGMDAVLFGVMMAVGEEQLFRGAITNFLLQYTGVIIAAVIGSAAFFMVYHLGMYQDNLNALLYVLTIAIVLAYVDIIGGKLAPSILSHIINNVLAYSTITFTGLLAAVASNLQILVLISSVVLVMYLLIQRRKKKS